ncbi:hypothetical protein [Burkholderia anthina]|uniref:hypothetical protein n=1 Tax=Burkholderia anthina TaxID=179879 RepID=UPI00158C1447
MDASLQRRIDNRNGGTLVVPDGIRVGGIETTTEEYGGFEMKAATFGVDLGKRVFQLHSVAMDIGEIDRRQIKREHLATFSAKQAPALIVAAVAPANKMARTIWALLAHTRADHPGYVAQAA